jgi:pimeloyl-ACP methyl ester carboxylesterase
MSATEPTKNTDIVTSADGTSVAVERHGTGPAVIFIGPTLADRSAGRPPMTELSANFTTFNYDRRGRGDSGDTKPSAVEREIEDLAAVIDAAGGQAFVFGGSSGGVLALDAAAAGLPILKLALDEPPLKVDDTIAPVPLDTLEQLGELLDTQRRGDAVEYYMTVMMGVPPDQVARMRHAPFWAQWEALAPTLRYDAEILEGTQAGRPLPAERWAALTVPTLVLDGGDSPEFMHSGAQALADLKPRVITRHTLPGQTHAVDVHTLADVLTEYFAATPGA